MLFRRLKYWAAKRRFQAMCLHWDEAIERARQKHEPTKALQAAKQAWLHEIMGRNG